jgi:soluble lytic murein transglycosylase-like protein
MRIGVFLAALIAFAPPAFAKQNSHRHHHTRPHHGPAPASAAQKFTRGGALDAMIARHAAANALPAELMHRVAIRESRYNPRARNGGNLGLMQIRHATARGVGYTGPAAGLLDPETNLTYAVRYLAGAYRAAGGNAGRAVSLYASGYRGRGVREPAQAVAWSAPTEMRTMPVALREPAVTTMRDDALRFVRY